MLVDWKTAVELFTFAHRHLETSPEARHFVETYVGSALRILTQQSPEKIVLSRYSDIQETLSISCLIVASDLAIQLARNGTCLLLDYVLSHVFKCMWQNAPFDKVRMHSIESFRSESGFSRLNSYLLARVQDKDSAGTSFPTVETIQHILIAILDDLVATAPSVPVKAADAVDARQAVLEADAVQISQAVMLHLSALSDDELNNVHIESLSATLNALQRIFDRLAGARCDALAEFHAFWRRLALTLIRAPYLPLKLAGWEQVNEMIKAVMEHRPPPRSVICSGAGTELCNGEYHFTGAATPEGYVLPGTEASYVRVAPESPTLLHPSHNGTDSTRHAATSTSKTLTLFRCIMRSSRIYWYISEANEEQPGTDRDIDYYAHSNHQEARHPPLSGWHARHSIGVMPPPTLTPIGVLFPPGGEWQTLEHQLAYWFICNAVFDLLLCDDALCDGIVEKSLLLEFLCELHPTTYTVYLVLHAVKRRTRELQCREAVV
jgi:hypothetical protein